jgi:multidrug efflux system outer membrane protein
MSRRSTPGRRVPLVLAALAAALGGCAAGPDYRRPALEVPAGYRDAPAPDAAAAAGEPLATRDWTQVYEDPALQALIRRALERNEDLRASVARIDQARATLGVARLQLFPGVSGTAGGTRGQSSLYSSPLVTESTRNHDTFDASVSLSYSVDLWGRVRRLAEAARADLATAEWSRRGVVVTLIADVADAWYGLLALDRQLDTAHRTVEIRQKFFDLTRAQHERGAVTGLDVATAEAQLAAARGTVRDLERQIAQTENALSTLIAAEPGPIARPPVDTALPGVPDVLPAGLPAALLERRPDVQAAEAALHAANARVGVARAALFPNVSLTGTLGSLSGALKQLFSEPARTWTASARLVQPLVDPAANLYQVELANARRREALAIYERTVRTAFQEVSDGLIGYQKSREFAAEQLAQVEALRRAESIALARYRSGYASYFEVISADRDLFTAELALSSAQRQTLTERVRLYRVLGGGW